MSNLVSIIIPTFNRISYLGETLDSILSQTYTNWECIVIDDGSDDETDQLMRFYCQKDMRIKFYIRPSNMRKGANSCRNYGFRLSQGQYINWFDSDDLMHPSFLFNKMEALEGSNAVCSICAFNKFEIKNGKQFLYETTNLGVENLFQNIVIQKYAVPTHGPLWRKTFLNNKILFDEKLNISQDLEFHSRMFWNNPEVKVVKDSCFYLRRGHENITSGFYNDMQKYYDSYFRVRKEIIRRYSNNKIIKKYYLNELMGIFRYLLTLKDFCRAKNVLKYLEKESGPLSFKFKMRFYKIKLIFNFIKFFGVGETRLKKHLYLLN